MSRVAEIRRSVGDYRTAALITGALQEISAAKMQDLRLLFERNMQFFSGIREVYGIVKAHAIELEKGGQLQKKEKGRTIYIGLTSNKRFNGTLNRDVVRSMLSMIDRVEDSDFHMIGLTGVQTLDEASAPSHIKRTSFSDDIPSQAELQDLLSLIDTHERVFVVYPKFINPFRQEVVMTDITQTPAALASPAMKADYIFEPEIPGMLAFFEAQVRRALFERIMLETELARAASRTMRMRDSQDRADELRRSYEHSLAKEYATIADIELMETFIGFNFWKNESRSRV